MHGVADVESEDGVVCRELADRLGDELGMDGLAVRAALRKRVEPSRALQVVGPAASRWLEPFRLEPRQQRLDRCP